MMRDVVFRPRRSTAERRREDDISGRSSQETTCSVLYVCTSVMRYRQVHRELTQSYMHVRVPLVAS